MIRLVPLLLLVGCNSGTASIPPCNGLLIFFGALDVQLDCPASNAIKLIERTKQ